MHQHHTAPGRASEPLPRRAMADVVVHRKLVHFAQRADRVRAQQAPVPRHRLHHHAHVPIDVRQDTIVSFFAEELTYFLTHYVNIEGARYEGEGSR